jgi:preprotein translocase subunit SecE
MGEEVSIEKDFWTRVREYVSDVRVEMKRVTWPGKQEIYGTTLMVVLTTFLFGIYFWLCDMVFLRTVSKVMRFFMGHG